MRIIIIIFGYYYYYYYQTVIYLAELNGKKVIIKMISEKSESNPIAMHEFDVEHGN